VKSYGVRSAPYTRLSVSIATALVGCFKPVGALRSHGGPVIAKTGVFFHTCPVAKSASRPRRAFVKYFRRLAGLCLLAVLAGGAALFYPQHLLTVDSGPVTADVMVVLGGGSNSERAKYAVELYRAGAAPRILCSGLGDAGANENLLKRAGVPASAILVEDQSRTTRENAQLSIPLLRRLGARRVIIVTSWYHTPRTSPSIPGRPMRAIPPPPGGRNPSAAAADPNT